MPVMNKCLRKCLIKHALWTIVAAGLLALIIGSASPIAQLIGVGIFLAASTISVIKDCRKTCGVK